MTEKMPFAAIPHALALDCDLSDGAYRLYGVLLQFAWKERQTWVSQGTLADAMSVSLDTIQRRLKELEEVNLIRVERRGARRTNLVHIASEQEVLAVYGAANLRYQERGDAADLRPTMPQICGIRKEEDTHKKKEAVRTQEQVSSIEGAAAMRIGNKLMDVMIEALPEYDDEHLWSLYHRLTFQDPEEGVRNSHTRLLGAITTEIRNRTLGDVGT
jgi:DNA-binding transcriptional MocR family regulator